MGDRDRRRDGDHRRLSEILWADENEVGGGPEDMI